MPTPTSILLQLFASSKCPEKYLDRLRKLVIRICRFLLYLSKVIETSIFLWMMPIILFRFLEKRRRFRMISQIPNVNWKGFRCNRISFPHIPAFAISTIEPAIFASVFLVEIKQC